MPFRTAPCAEYKFAYYSSPNTESVYSTVIERDVSRFYDASEWINHRRRYFGKSRWLLYTAGRFYLDVDDEMGFKNCEEYDFEGAVGDTVSAYASALETYVSEKNDITSELFEYDSEGLLLLVCKKINSVILFDVREMRILEAYKVNEKIIGFSMNDAMDTLNLYLDSPMNNIALKINLPDGHSHSVEPKNAEN